MVILIVDGGDSSVSTEEVQYNRYYKSGKGFDILLCIVRRWLITFLLTFLKESHPKQFRRYIQCHITYCLEKLLYGLEISQIIIREVIHKNLRLRRQKLVLKVHKNIQMDKGDP